LSLSVYDLAVEVVLYLVAFQRRVEDGEEVSYENTRAEALALLNDLDQRSHGEPGLWDNWTKARTPLVYLIDEVMILNCNWPYRDRWADECLEVALLGHPEALGGENFYKECDEGLHELELAERHERHDYQAKTEIVMVYYVALQTGFKGEYKGHVFSKLPAYAQTRAKKLFPEAEEHTVLLDPNYEPVMRLLYVFIGFVLIIALYLGSTWVYWAEMVDELKNGAKDVPVPTSQEGQPSAAQDDAVAVP
jgi:type VI protein secretion system component VasF